MRVIKSRLRVILILILIVAPLILKASKENKYNILLTQKQKSIIKQIAHVISQ